MKAFYLLGILVAYESAGFSWPCIAVAVIGAAVLFLTGNKVRFKRLHTVEKG